MSKKPSIDLISLVNDIVHAKKIEAEAVYNAIKVALKKTYEKKINPEANIEIIADKDHSEIIMYRLYDVVAKVTNKEQQVNKTGAKKLDPSQKYEYGAILRKQVNFQEEFEYLAIKMVLNIIVKEIQEAEKNKVIDNYSQFKEQIMYGTVEEVEEKHHLIINVSDTKAILPYNNLILGESYKKGDDISFLALEIGRKEFNASILASRSSDLFLIKLLELEVPEILENIIEVMAVSRKPGVLSKVIVKSHNQNINAVATCIGAHGLRIKEVSGQLNGEKIELCAWDEDMNKMLLHLFSPAKIIDILKFPNQEENQQGEWVYNLIVPDEQLSLAIGKKGLNISLIVKLMHTKINILSYQQAQIVDLPLSYKTGNLTVEEHMRLQQRLAKKKQDFVNNERNKALIEKAQAIKTKYEAFLNEQASE